jgi:hypothetical protein
MPCPSPLAVGYVTIVATTHQLLRDSIRPESSRRALVVVRSHRRPARWLPRLDPGALARPQRVGLGPLREPAGVLALQLQHALGVVEQRLTRTVEERLLAGRVQVAQLAFQRRIVQPIRGKTELPCHGSPPFHPANGPIPSPPDGAETISTPPVGVEGGDPLDYTARR